MPTKKASIVKNQKGSLKNNIVNMEEIKQKKIILKVLTKGGKGDASL